MSDNGWYEKGEFPPVLAWCVYDPKDVDDSNRMIAGKDVYFLSLFHCKNGEECVAIEHNVFGLKCYTASPVDFRPIKTDRALAIEEMAKVMSKGTVGTYISVAEKLYDAGYRKNES